MTLMNNVLTSLFKQTARSRDLATSDAARQLETAKRELRQAEKEMRHAANKTARAQAELRYSGILERHLQSFRQEADFLTEEMTEVWESYANAYETFEQEAPPFKRPRRIEGYDSKAATFKLVGIACALTDYLLAVYQTARGDEYGLATALFVSAFGTALMVILAHGVMAAAERHSPPDVRDLLMTVLWCAVPVTIVPLAVFFLFRSLTGDYLPDFVLTLLQPVNDVALWLSTLGLIPVGAAFLGLSKLYGWSGRLTKRFEQLRRLRVEVESYRNELLAQAYRRAGYRVLPDDPSPLRPEDPPDSAPGASTAAANRPGRPYVLPRQPAREAKPADGNNAWRPAGMLLLLCLPLALSACGGASREHFATVAAQERPAPAGPVELQIFIDASQSLDVSAATQAAQHLHAQLMEIVQATGATLLSVVRFADNGQGEASRTLELPVYTPPALPMPKRGKLPPHLEEARRKRFAILQAEAEQRAQADHRAALKQALDELDVSLLLPPQPSRNNPPCTDLVGVLGRIAQRPPGIQRYTIILTDGYQSCGSRQLPVLRGPQGAVRTLVLLVPANLKESRGQRSYAQYEERQAALSKAAPWLVIVPGAEGRLTDYLKPRTSPEKLVLLQP